MSTWYSKPLGDGVDAQAPTWTIQQAYQVLELKGNLPVDCAIFSYYDLRENVVTVYFSPTAQTLARAFGADPCVKPTRKEGFAMLVGSPRAWDVLFGK